MNSARPDLDLVIIGGGVGGVAAALAALKRGLNVMMVEEHRWIGGQLTVQATPPDEHPWIETMGCTASYREFRDRVRAHYRDQRALTARARADEHLNPGNATVSKLAFEPPVAESVLRDMLAPWLSSGALRLMTSTRLIACHVDRDRIESVDLQHIESEEFFSVSTPYVIDATELGEVIDLAGIEHVTGSESHHETGEPHAPAESNPDNMQAFSWPFALEYVADGDFTLDQPADYPTLRHYRPVHWPGEYLGLTYTNPRTLEPVEADFAPDSDGPDDLLIADQSRDPGSQNLWVYRRILWRHHFTTSDLQHDVTLVNWPMTDYLDGPLFGRSEDENLAHREGARQLSLSLAYWLQTEAPRPDGSTGWPGLRLRPDLMGTNDGLAMGPYVRESRRIKALTTIVEQDVSLNVRGDHGALRYDDSVGIGAYRIDLHPSTGGDDYIDIPSCPYQIPLSALIPVRMQNVIAAAKNIGTTHITNGCYRLHPTEWNIGEAAGSLVALCRSRRTGPHAVATTKPLIHDLQRDLANDGVELAWQDGVRGY